MANKTELNLHVQKFKLGTVTYQTEKTDSGEYRSVVHCGDRKFKSLKAHANKKLAEDDAAGVAMKHFTAPKDLRGDDGKQTQENRVQQLDIDPVSGQSSALPVHPLKQKFVGDIVRSVGKPCSAVRIPASDEERERAWSQLREYTLSHNLPEPTHVLKFQHDRMQSGKLTVGDDEFDLESNETSLAYDEAKHQLTLKALKALKIDTQVPSPQFNTQQQQQQQQQQPTHQYLTNFFVPASPHQFTASPVLIPRSYDPFPASPPPLIDVAAAQQKSLLPPSVFTSPPPQPQRGQLFTVPLQSTYQGAPYNRDILEVSAPPKVTPYGTAPSKATPPGTATHTDTLQGTTLSKVTPQDTIPAMVTPQGIATHNQGTIPAKITVTPQGIATHKVTPQGTIPAMVTPQGIATHKVTPQGTIPAKVTSQSTATHKDTPQGTSPSKGTLQGTAKQTPQVSASSKATTQGNSTPPELNSKQVLHEFCQKSKLPLPVYTLHSPTDTVGYIAEITMNDKTYRSSVEPNKKKAEQLAATAVLQGLGLRTNGVVTQGNHSMQSSQPSPATQSGSVPSLKMVARSATVTQQHSSGQTVSDVSYKNRLQEFFQKRHLPVPTYETEKLSNSLFRSCLTYSLGSTQQIVIHGIECSTKKAAEQSAAQQACCKLKLT